MIGFSNPLSDNAENKWRYQLDQFVRENELELAALAWGLLQEWGESKDTLGIDLKPTPHFVACSRDSIEKFNRKVDNHIQEILGVLDGYKPEEEVVIIVIGKGQIKLINFKPEPSPPVCFEQADRELDRLIKKLEASLIGQLDVE
jgi:hypothetical protein